MPVSNRDLTHRWLRQASHEAHGAPSRYRSYKLVHLSLLQGLLTFEVSNRFLMCNWKLINLSARNLSIINLSACKKGDEWDWLKFVEVHWISKSSLADYPFALGKDQERRLEHRMLKSLDEDRWGRALVSLCRDIQRACILSTGLLRSNRIEQTVVGLWSSWSMRTHTHTAGASKLTVPRAHKKGSQRPWQS